MHAGMHAHTSNAITQVRQASTHPQALVKHTQHPQHIGGCLPSCTEHIWLEPLVWVWSSSDACTRNSTHTEDQIKM
jgi:hypothetical protein